MNTLVLLSLGLVVGAAAGGAGGAVAGVVIAVLAAGQSDLRKALREEADRRQALETRLAMLEQGVMRLEPTDAAPSPAPVVPVVPIDVPQETLSIPPAAQPTAATAAPDMQAAIPATSVPAPNAVQRDRPQSPIARWLLSGNLVARLGVIFLFVGVAFFLKFAADRGLLPPELRVASVAAAGLAMLGGGFRLRGNRPMFALILQGGGLGLLYLAVFAMLRLYGMIGETAAFAVFGALGLACVGLALRHEARALAILGMIGAFLAPVLASTGQGSHVVLFGYYLMLNAVILCIVWFRPWRALAATGFLFTFLVGLVWGYRYYRPEYFGSTEPFLLSFFTIYALMPILFARREAPRITDVFQGGLLFGTPVIASLLQSGLARDFEYGMAWSALGFGVFYLAAWAWLRRQTWATSLALPYLAIALVFLTLAVPYAFGARVTVGLWALEGAGLVWVSMRQDSAIGRAAGLGLQACAAFVHLSGFTRLATVPPILNELFLDSLLLAAAGFASAASLRLGSAQLRSVETRLPDAAFVWGTLWWYVMGLGEIHRHAPVHTEPAAALAFFAASCALGELVGARYRWRAPRYQHVLLLAAIGLIGYTMVTRYHHPLAHGGFIAWPLAFSVWYWALQRHEEDGLSFWIRARHALAFWLVLVLGSAELAWLADELIAKNSVWSLCAWVLVPAAALLFVSRRGRGMPWPLGPHHDDYVSRYLLPVAIYTGVWTVFANLRSAGSPAPLPYAPLANPLDVCVVLAIAAVAAWWKVLADLERRIGRRPLQLDWVIYGLAFLWISGLVARTVHHYAGIPFTRAALYASTLLQACLSLLWTAVALGLMIRATRSTRRPLWIAGAALLGLVTAKLLLVDLANSATVARFVTFIGVGLLFLAVGYFSPVPPAAVADQERGTAAG